MQGSLASFEKRYVPKVLITEEANDLLNGDPTQRLCMALLHAWAWGIERYTAI